MRNSIALFLICYLVLISGYNAIEVKTKPQPTASPDEVTKPTTFNPIPYKTAALITTPSSTKNSSTTEEPITKPTTKKITPIPTPTIAPIPPTPIPDPQATTWNISEKDNVIIAHMAVQLSITYNVTDNKVTNKTALINIPANNKTLASGIFTPNLQAMKLSWKSSGDGNNSLSLVFRSSNTSKTYWLSRLEVSIQAEDLPDFVSPTPLTVFHEQGHFNTSIGNSYRCVKLQTFNLMKDNVTQVIGHVKVTDLQFQAFKTGHDTSFGLAEDCAFDTPDIVPIAVGCVLAGLVVIILVGYLITRRSQARGYLSM